MPSRGTYQITSREEGKAAERDQSYRSCILAMFIFLLLCIVLILASWPWKKFHTVHHHSEENERNSGAMAGVRGEHATIEPDSEIRTNPGKKLDEKKKAIIESEAPFERDFNNASSQSPEIYGTRTEETSRMLEKEIDETRTTEETLRIIEKEINATRTTEETTRIIEKETNATTTTEETTRIIEKETNATTTTEETLRIIEKEMNVAKTTEETSRISEKGMNAMPTTEETPRISEEEINSTKITEETSRISEEEINATPTTEETSKIIEKQMNATRTVEETSRMFENIQEEISMTVETFSTPETTVKMIFNATDSFFLEAEETDESAVQDEEYSRVTFVPSTEKSTIEVDEKSSTDDSTTNLFEKNWGSTKEIKTTERPFISYTSLQRLLVAKYFGNDSTTPRNKDSMEDWLDEMEPRTIQESTEFATNPSTKFVSSTESIITTPSIERVTPSTATEKKIEISTTNSIGEITSLPPELIREREIHICQSGSCKQLASKMLSYMNHSADPCDDFYEYACGGLEADRQINEKDLVLRVWEKIEKQARKRENSEYFRFNEYYESCLKYESSFDIYHRTDLAKESLEKIGNFYTSTNWPGDFKDFTTLFANMLLQNRPLLFDIVPDVNEKNPNSFTLKIGPAIDTNPFQLLNVQNLCQNESEDIHQEFVDLGHLYDTYKKCRNDTKATISAISQALKDLGIFENLKNTSNISQYLNETVTNIDHEIIEGILMSYPPESEIRESYRSKHYTVTTLGELEADCKMLNWTQLINSLTGLTLGPNAELQIYYKDQLTRAFRHLEEFASRNELGLNNALMGLYAQNLYQDLVTGRSPKNLERQCFYNAAYFMEAEASGLYMSSFTTDEIKNMQALMQRVFEDLKETLKKEIQESEWAVEWGREVLLKKLDDVRMSLPDLSYVNKNYAHELNITDNYFENSLTLMKKYRSMIYSVLQKNPSDPEQIWTFFASPFHSNTRTIYGLNLILIPFGAIDWPLLSEIGEKFDYLNMAIIGNLVAREIARNFDTNGIRYWNGSRDSEFALMTDSDSTKVNYENYINCQRYFIYQEDVDMSLPATGQHVTFRIPQLTLNDRLSDAVGMRLAHDTLARLGKEVFSEKRLPWLDLDISQLFYLVYAQTQCTKAQLTSSYVSLYENPILPSRVRIFVTASNNKILGESWKCPEGSQLLPTPTCGVFPHLEYRGGSPDPA